MIRQKELEGLELLRQALVESRTALLERSRTEDVERGPLLLSRLLSDAQPCLRDENEEFLAELERRTVLARAALKQRDMLACRAGEWPRALSIYCWERFQIEWWGMRIIFVRSLLGGPNIAQLRQRR